MILIELCINVHVPRKQRKGKEYPVLVTKDGCVCD